MKLIKLLILFLFLSLKGFSQQNPTFTFKYDKAEYCAGSNTFANPQIFNDKGELLNRILYSSAKFKYSIKSGNGKLTIDEMGKIDIIKSDVGEYVINFKFRLIESDFVIHIKNCN